MKTNAISYYHFINYNISKGLSFFYLGVNCIYSISVIAMMCFISIGGVVDLISKFEIGFLYRVIIAVIFAVVQFSFSVKPFDFIKLIAQYMTLLAVIFVFLFVLVVMFIDCKAIKGTVCLKLSVYTQSKRTKLNSSHIISFQLQKIFLSISSFL